MKQTLLTWAISLLFVFLLLFAGPMLDGLNATPPIPPAIL